MDTINNIFEFHSLALDSVKRFKKHRYIYNDIINHHGKSFLGITGLRGVGKSIILKQIALQNSNSVYISLDTVKNIDLFDIIKQLNNNYDVEIFLLDEVHFYKGIAEALKKVYDFLNVKVIFTSSVSLGMYKSAYDLSRRIKLIEIYPFSFREFLYFYKDIDIPSLTFNNIIDKEWRMDHLKYGYLFEEYLKGGNIPFNLEEPDLYPLLRNILHTIIYKDIPRIFKLTVGELELIENTITFIAKSSVDGINISTISRNIGITKYKAQSYINILQDAFVLTSILPKGSNVLKEPKILLMPPFRLLFQNYNDCIGALREEFFIENIRCCGFTFNYLKSNRGEKIPDYYISDNDNSFIIEIGGKNKGREQFKGVNEKKQIIFTHSERLDGIRRPLFLTGFITKR